MTETRTTRIEVSSNRDTLTHTAWVTTAHQLGITTLTGCSRTRIFFISGQLTSAEIEQIAQELLTDPVTERYHIGRQPAEGDAVIEVTLQPGVTDPIAENLERAIAMIGIDGVEQTATGSRYDLAGELLPDDLARLATTVFSNPVIQLHTINQPVSAPFVSTQHSDGRVETIQLRDASDDHLLAISADRRLSLDLDEMQAIQAWYRDAERDPTDIELEMLAQTWSEHCVHKTFKALIHFEDEHGHTEEIDGLLKTYIRGATETVNKDWIRSAFVDNAGIVKFDDDYDLAFKVETHNHPSALEPFGGANTGVGGVVRDVLGVSARPIANTDVLLFGEQDMPDENLIDGVLHPRRVKDGVIHGIEDYGNKMGIPTVNGAIFYDEGYTQNPLVYCGCLGILPHGSHRTNPQPGDYIVVLGGRTGRDGLRGATFSSMEMDTSTSEIASISVQIGHPINEKQVQEVILQARDAGLYTAITDCGAGGLSSAIGEMGEDLGAEVQLQDIPLKYPGLRPWEIWLSEAQERMVMAVPPENWEALQRIAQGQDVEATHIGSFGTDAVIDDRRLILRYSDRIVGDITMNLLHDCLPRRELVATWTPPPSATIDPQATPDFDLKETLLALLAHPNIASKEETVRRYDHEVQGGTVVKPLVGVDAHGHGDSSVLVPLETMFPLTLNTSPTRGEGLEAQEHQAANVIKKPVRGVALSVGICPQYGEYDPYAMAWAAVDEAFRNLVAVGADPDQVSLLDNFCWGNPNLPDRLGSLVLAAKGCHDAAVTYNAPFISGKDSLNNEYADADGTRHAIPGTLLISAMGIVPDVEKTVTMDLKAPGNLLYVIGETRNELGGSHYNRVHGTEGGTVPQPNDDALDTMRALHTAIQAGLVQSCHDISEGGLAVALAEMCIAGRLGADVDVCGAIPGLEDTGDYSTALWDTIMLFSESTTRFIVEVTEAHRDEFEALVDTELGLFGRVTEKPVLVMSGCEVTYPELDIAELERAFRGEQMMPTADTPPDSREAIERPEQRTIVRHDNPRVLILHANGTNRDRDAKLACELAGGAPEIVHVNQLLAGERRLLDYHMLVIPGGFSYGDDLGAGQLWAQDLRYKFRDALEQFARDGRPVLGICNGFQVLLKSGLLPYTDFASGEERDVTLTYNESSRFECRWVHLKPNPNSPSLFTSGIEGLIHCPVAHGEGRVMTRNQDAHDRLWNDGHVALTYVNAQGAPAGYPANPNGSQSGIAALCNREGNVMGLMPHPEDHIFPWQHPHVHRDEGGQLGLIMFENGIDHA